MCFIKFIKNTIYFKEKCKIKRCCMVLKKNIMENSTKATKKNRIVPTITLLKKVCNRYMIDMPVKWLQKENFADGFRRKAGGIMHKYG